MEKEVKFSKDELEKLNDIQKKYASVQLKLGQIGFAKLRIDNEINNVQTAEQNLREEFKNIQDGEEKFIEEITKKYGEGVLDPQTGVFSLNK
tara:strand:+ start:570 stop:845 length:276 start_codon:yes stop_codon:yes gene_type:complete